MKYRRLQFFICSPVLKQPRQHLHSATFAQADHIIIIIIIIVVVVIIILLLCHTSAGWHVLGVSTKSCLAKLYTLLALSHKFIPWCFHERSSWSSCTCLGPSTIHSIMDLSMVMWSNKYIYSYTGKRNFLYHTVYLRSIGMWSFESVSRVAVLHNKSYLKWQNSNIYKFHSKI